MPAQSRIRWCAVALFAIALVALWALRGIHDDKEAVKYIGCANDLLRGDVHDLVGNYKAYASYVLFLVPFVAIDALWAAVIAQSVLAVMAAFALARLVERLSGTARAGTMALVLTLFCYPFQEWVLTLYTESFFASIAVLFLERATREGPVRWPAFGLALVLFFARPVGVLFVVPAMIWRMPLPTRLARLVKTCAYTIVLFLVLVMPGVARHQLGVIVEGHVICGFPERPDALSRFQGTSILDAQVMLFEEPAYAIGLFARRALSLFTLTRPYYSGAHNLLLLPLYTLYALAVLGWWHAGSNKPNALMMTIFLLNTGLIGFTYDEWNGRFLVPIWPLVIAWAAVGAHGLWIDRFGKRSGTG